MRRYWLSAHDYAGGQDVENDIGGMDAAARVIAGSGKTFPPFAERLLRGDEHGPALVASADKIERHAGLGLILDDIGEVVEDQQVKAVEPVDCGLEVEFVARDLELLDQVRRPGEENLPSCVCDLGLAGPLQILQDADSNNTSGSALAGQTVATILARR